MTDKEGVRGSTGGSVISSSKEQIGEGNRGSTGSNFSSGDGEGGSNSIWSYFSHSIRKGRGLLILLGGYMQKYKFNLSYPSSYFAQSVIITSRCKHSL